MTYGPKSLMAMLFLFMTLSLSLGGCAFLKDAIGLGQMKPQVHLEKIEIRGVTLSSLELRLKLKVDNPNDSELKLSNLKYSMKALGDVVAEGSYTEKIKIAAQGPTYVQLPVSIRAKEALALIKAILSGKKEIIAYVTAVADFDTVFGAVEVDFEDSKTLVKFGN